MHPNSYRFNDDTFESSVMLNWRICFEYGNVAIWVEHEVLKAHRGDNKHSISCWVWEWIDDVKQYILRYSDLASKCNNRSAVYCVRPCYLCVQLPWSLEHVLQSSIIIGDSFCWFRWRLCFVADVWLSVIRTSWTCLLDYDYLVYSYVFFIVFVVPNLNSQLFWQCWIIIYGRMIVPNPVNDNTLKSKLFLKMGRVFYIWSFEMNFITEVVGFQW